MISITDHGLNCLEKEQQEMTREEKFVKCGNENTKGNS